MKDVLIGAADLYGWEQIRPWVVSARHSGFDGDIYLICYRVDSDMVKAEEYGVELYQVEHTPYSQLITHEQQGSPTQAHNLRFYHAWELLTRLRKHEEVLYRHVIMTDARDVIFQSNPSEWLAYNLPRRVLVAPSEHIAYNREPWNQFNLVKGFGETFWEIEASDWKAYNVGTIAGQAEFMAGLFHTIYRMTEGRYYPSDQSSFNVLLHTQIFNDALYASELDGWAAQMGTTNDPTKDFLWARCCEARPRILEDGTVVNSRNEPFVLVHQYDRVPQLKTLISERYK
jgi:hypothetical protein